MSDDISKLETEKKVAIETDIHVTQNTEEPKKEPLEGEIVEPPDRDIDISKIKPRKLKFRASRKLAAELREIFKELDELGNGDIQSLPDLILALHDYADELIPRVCIIKKEDIDFLDFDQMIEIFEMFKNNNKGLVKLLGLAKIRLGAKPEQPQSPPAIKLPIEN